MIRLFLALAMILACEMSWAGPRYEGGKKDPEYGGGGSCTADLRIYQKAPEVVRVGQDFVLTIILKNFGTCDLGGVRLVELLSNRLSFKASYPRSYERNLGSHGQGGTLHWDRIDIPAGASHTIEVHLKATGRPERYAIHQACASHPWVEQVCDEGVSYLSSLVVKN